VTASARTTVKCAIYTRKSSEEGLEQSFNSLDAQREACEAFIISQRQEGWRALTTRFDDGGYSGATMERPGLNRLLDDVRKGAIDVIIVYKVDRLTRSLADFAKIVEILDSKRVAFVSVTQQFNTTSSMGRLTLNVLLSFAQFEREVTGERIRDKIAASKRKGMWMGGRVPLGYDLRQRKLCINIQESKLIRRIFDVYLELGCVSKLKQQLDRDGIKTKLRLAGSGRRSGATSYSRGALYHILKNRIYLGEIPHRDVSYPGQHEPIVSRELWNKVQERLTNENKGRKNVFAAKSPSLLQGLLYDVHGARFTPSHTLKNGRRYRYYVCQSVMRNPGKPQQGPVRLPAYEIEQQLGMRLCHLLGSHEEIFDKVCEVNDSPSAVHRMLTSAEKLSQHWNTTEPGERHELVRRVVKRIVIHQDLIDVQIYKAELRALLLGERTSRSSTDGHQAIGSTDEVVSLSISSRLLRCRGEVRLVVASDYRGKATPKILPSLVKAVACAYGWYEQVVLGKVATQRSFANAMGVSDRYVRRILRCAFLAPDIVEAILEGRQPPAMTLERMRRKPPMDWEEQRKLLGFSNQLSSSRRGT